MVAPAGPVLGGGSLYSQVRNQARQQCLHTMVDWLSDEPRENGWKEGLSNTWTVVSRTLDVATVAASDEVLVTWIDSTLVLRLIGALSRGAFDDNQILR